jgi:hypothetical protein
LDDGRTRGRLVRLRTTVGRDLRTVAGHGSTRPGLTTGAAAALEELLDTRNAMTRVLLGGADVG